MCSAVVAKSEYEPNKFFFLRDVMVYSVGRSGSEKVDAWAACRVSAGAMHLQHHDVPGTELFANICVRQLRNGSLQLRHV